MDFYRFLSISMNFYRFQSSDLEDSCTCSFSLLPQRHPHAEEVLMAKEVPPAELPNAIKTDEK